MKKKWISLILAGAMLSESCVGCGQQQETAQSVETETVEEQQEDPAGKVVLTVWGAEEDQELLGTIIENFKAENKGTEFEVQIAAVGEGECKQNILSNVLECADVFAFADDQLMALAAAGVLKCRGN